MPCVTPKPVKTSNDPIVMLRADLETNGPRWGVIASVSGRLKQWENLR